MNDIDHIEFFSITIIKHYFELRVYLYWYFGWFGPVMDNKYDIIIKTPVDGRQSLF